MYVPEVIPVPVQPEIQKNLIPAAVKRAEPPIFDPESDGGDAERRKKKRKRRRGDGRDSQERDDRSRPDEANRGNHIDIRA